MDESRGRGATAIRAASVTVGVVPMPFLSQGGHRLVPGCPVASQAPGSQLDTLTSIGTAPGSISVTRLVNTAASWHPIRKKNSTPCAGPSVPLGTPAGQLTLTQRPRQFAAPG